MVFFAAETQADESKKILILGDSLSAAHNLKIQDGWPHLLQQKYAQSGKNNIIINASISGETTFGGKSRLAKLLKQHQPQILIIELGGNDGLRGLNFKASQNNLSAMVEMGLQKNINILLLGVRLPPNLGVIYNQHFQSMYQSVQQQYQINYLPRFLEGIAENKQLMQSDGIHPTKAAQPLLMDKVYQALIEVPLTQFAE